MKKTIIIATSLFVLGGLYYVSLPKVSIEKADFATNNEYVEYSVKAGFVNKKGIKKLSDKTATQINLGFNYVAIISSEANKIVVAIKKKSQNKIYGIIIDFTNKTISKPEILKGT